MNAIELARRMADLGETGEALRAYALALGGELAPRERFEAALYTLQNEGDYKLAYTAFVSLCNAGQMREQSLSVLTQAFYEPNVKPLKNRYERNRRALEKYPYLFRRDFPDFDALPLRFYPFDDNGGYVPLDVGERRFRDFMSTGDAVVRHHFFRDLEKPVLAHDVFSQYELAYLNDNVRESEWVGRENHIYLHYTDWGEFCSYLAVLDLRPLVESRKAVFLIGDELKRYPIDFKETFGVDYAQYPVRPVGVREVNKLIWHTQLTSHNGGDFFNEIFDAHPNLLSGSSVMFDDLTAEIAAVREALRRSKHPADARAALASWNAPSLVDELYALRGLTDKDVLVALYLRDNAQNAALDRAARIAPALFFQPHFGNLIYDASPDGHGGVTLCSAQADALRDSGLFAGFHCVKTFSPIRRPTSSYGGTIRFSLSPEYGQGDVVEDQFLDRILNRSDLRDPDDSRFRDAVLVRLEDGKLNPRATFSALAAFLDLPYTESMTYGSVDGNRDPYGWGEAYQNGFFSRALDNNFEDYISDDERYLLELFLRDVYDRCGYDFQRYDGAAPDAARLDELLAGCVKLDGFMRESWRRTMAASFPPEEADDAAEQVLARLRAKRRRTMHLLLSARRVLNRRGVPLVPITLLKPDEALLERPLYR